MICLIACLIVSCGGKTTDNDNSPEPDAIYVIPAYGEGPIASILLENGVRCDVVGDLDSASGLLGFRTIQVSSESQGESADLQTVFEFDHQSVLTRVQIDDKFEFRVYSTAGEFSTWRILDLVTMDSFFVTIDMSIFDPLPTKRLESRHESLAGPIKLSVTCGAIPIEPDAIFAYFEPKLVGPYFLLPLTPDIFERGTYYIHDRSTPALLTPEDACGVIVHIVTMLERIEIIMETLACTSTPLACLGVAAMREALLELKHHLVAAVTGGCKAVGTAIETFDQWIKRQGDVVVSLVHNQRLVTRSLSLTSGQTDFVLDLSDGDGVPAIDLYFLRERYSNADPAAHYYPGCATSAETQVTLEIEQLFDGDTYPVDFSYLCSPFGCANVLQVLPNGDILWLALPFCADLSLVVRDARLGNELARQKLATVSLEPRDYELQIQSENPVAERMSPWTINTFLLIGSAGSTGKFSGYGGYTATNTNSSRISVHFSAETPGTGTTLDCELTPEGLCPAMVFKGGCQIEEYCLVHGTPTSMTQPGNCEIRLLICPDKTTAQVTVTPDDGFVCYEFGARHQSPTFYVDKLDVHGPYRFFGHRNY